MGNQGDRKRCAHVHKQPDFVFRRPIISVANRGGKAGNEDSRSALFCPPLPFVQIKSVQCWLEDRPVAGFCSGIA